MGIESVILLTADGQLIERSDNNGAGCSEAKTISVDDLTERQAIDLVRDLIQVVQRQRQELDMWGRERKRG